MIPPELQQRPQWVVWCLETRGGRPTKAPWIAGAHRTRRASTSDPATWRPFEDATAAVWADGVGYVFSAVDPFVGVDLDGCRDPATGALAPWARRVVSMFATYTEVSPSGTGVHVLARGHVPGPRHRRGPVEMYDSRRYFTITGQRLGRRRRSPRRQHAVDALYSEVFHVDAAEPVANGEIFESRLGLVGDDDSERLMG